MDVPILSEMLPFSLISVTCKITKEGVKDMVWDKRYTNIEGKLKLVCFVLEDKSALPLYMTLHTLLHTFFSSYSVRLNGSGKLRA